MSDETRNNGGGRLICKIRGCTNPILLCFGGHCANCAKDRYVDTGTNPSEVADE